MAKIKKLQSDFWKYPDGKIPYSDFFETSEPLQSIFDNTKDDSKNVKIEKGDEHIKFLEEKVNEANMKYVAKMAILKEKKK